MLSELWLRVAGLPSLMRHERDPILEHATLMINTVVTTGEKLRIAVIPARFVPELHYQENVFAMALHESGHDVAVFAVEEPGGSPGDASLPFRIERAKCVIRIRRTVIPCDSEVVRKLKAFNPAVAFVMAPNHGPGVVWMRSLSAECVVISSFSDLPWHRSSFTSWLKARWAREVVTRSAIVLAATGETRTLVGGWAGPELAGRVELFGLTFRPESLAGGNLPKPVRELLSRFPRLISVITRVDSSKELDLVFRSVERFLLREATAGFVFAGFGEDEEACRIKSLVEKSQVADRCVVLPMLQGPEIGAIFSVSVISVWSTVSIGIYHSLHCGCRVILREGQDAGHLLAHGEAAGSTYSSLDRIDEEIASVLSKPVPREVTQQIAAPYRIGEAMVRLVARATTASSNAAYGFTSEAVNVPSEQNTEPRR